MNQETLLASLKWRYAAKSFDADRKISPDDWAALEQALVLTPSSYGLQPWKFLVVQSLDLREKLRAVSWNQRQVTECSHYLVFAQREGMDEAYVDRYMKLIATTRGVTTESLVSFRNAIIGDAVHGPRAKVVAEWNARQSYIALGNFMAAAALLKIDTCPMEGLDPARYDEILSLRGTGYRTVVACAAGYRSPSDLSAAAPKVRFPREEMIQVL